MMQIQTILSLLQNVPQCTQSQWFLFRTHDMDFVCQECLYGDCNWEMQMAKSAGNGRPVPQYILRHLCECLKGLVAKFWPCECVTWVSKMAFQDMTRNSVAGTKTRATVYVILSRHRDGTELMALSFNLRPAFAFHRWEMMGRYSLTGI